MFSIRFGGTERIARVTVMPPLRCGFMVHDELRLYCAEPASWIRSRDEFAPTRYFCGAHRARGDLPLVGDLLFRRITLHVDVLFAGVTLLDDPARSEAVDVLERAVRSRGGLLNLHQVSSELCRHVLWPADQRGSGKRGKG